MTKMQAGTLLLSQVMDCQAHAINTSPLFTDLVTRFWDCLQIGKLTAYTLCT